MNSKGVEKKISLQGLGPYQPPLVSALAHIYIYMSPQAEEEDRLEA